MELELSQIIEVVRIPELDEPSLPVPSLEDQWISWESATNRTIKRPLSDLLKLIAASGGGAFYTPVQTGNKIIYIVPPEKEGSDFVEIPALKGYNFTITRDMLELDPNTEYAILMAGGFKVLGGAAPLITGQRFVLEVYELGQGLGGSAASGGGSMHGKILVNTNTYVNIANAFKRHTIRKSDAQLEIVLPDTALVPEDAIYYFESFIGNNRQHKFTTTNGQYIYVGDSSREQVYIGKGELFAFLRDSDGWYLIEGYEHVLNVGRPYATYKVGLNETRLDGTEELREVMPRLFEEIEQYGSSFVTDAVWNTPSASVAGRTVIRPFRGCWSKGSDTAAETMMRKPDLRDMALVGLANFGGVDNQRHQNIAGNYQRHEYESHGHNVTINRVNQGNADDISTIRGSTTVGDTGIITPGEDNTAIKASGGLKTRPDNIGIIWVCKY